MKFFKTEWHQVSSEFVYDIPDEEIVKDFEFLSDIIKFLFII